MADLPDSDQKSPPPPKPGTASPPPQEPPSTPTATSAPPGGSPPKQPPQASTATEPPDPSEFFSQLKQPPIIAPTADVLGNRRLIDVSDKELIEAFKKHPQYILKRVGWSHKKGGQRRRLNRLIQKNRQLQKILDQTFSQPPPVDEKTAGLFSQLDQIPTLSPTGWLSANRQLAQLKQKDKFPDENILSVFKNDPVNTLKVLQQDHFSRQRDRLAQAINRHLQTDLILQTKWHQVRQQLPLRADKPQRLDQLLKGTSLIIRDYGKARLKPRPQPQVVTEPEPPPVKAKDFVKAKAEPIPPPVPVEKQIKQDLSQHQDKLTNYLNSLGPGFFDHLASKDVKVRTTMFGQSIWNYLKLYRGGLANFYLHQGTLEFLYSLLGPVGNILRAIESKNMKFKTSWLKNPLNASSLLYYLKTLPEHGAFNIMALPARATFGVLARGGAPLLSTIHYYDDRRGKQVKKTVLTPLLATSQFSHSLAGGLDKLSGLAFNRKKFANFEAFTHHRFNQAFKTLTKAKKSKNKQEIKKAKKEIRSLLFKHDGGFFKGIFKKGLRNTARRLRQTQDDPFTFIFRLFGGFALDISLGLAVSLVGSVLGTIINFIPGVNILKARLIRFFNSSRWLTTSRIAGTTGYQFVRGVFSTTTLASGYIGYQLGSLLFPELTLATGINPVGGAFASIFSGFGAFYRISLNQARIGPGFNSLGLPATPVSWVQHFQELTAVANHPQLPLSINQNAAAQIEQLYIRGFKPGPITRFTNFLYKNWWLRPPVNGLAVGYLLAPWLQELLGWTPTTSLLSFAAADWFWQVKGDLFNTLAKKWFQPRWRFLNTSFISPHYKLFSLKNPSSYVSRINARFIQPTWLRIAYGRPAGYIYLERPWFRFAKNAAKYAKDALSRIQPYFRTFFNPGFFAGFALIQPLIASGWSPLLSTFMGPIAGSAAFLLLSRFVSGKTAVPMTSFNSLAWITTFMGAGIQLIGSFFGISFPAWWMPLWGFGIPTLLAFFPAITSAITSAVGAIGAAVSNAVISGLVYLFGAGALPAYMALAGVAYILGMATLVGVGIFALITITSSLWTPISEISAGPLSACFAIETTSDTVTLTPGETTKVCTTINTPQDRLFKKSYIGFSATLPTWLFELDLSSIAVTRQTINPPLTQSLSRRLPDPTRQFTWPDQLDNHQFSLVSWPDPLYEFRDRVLTLALATPIGPENIFSLQNQYPSLASSAQPYINYLVRIQQSTDRQQTIQYLLTELEARITIIKHQIKYLKTIVADLKKASTNSNINNQISHLNAASSHISEALTEGPVAPSIDCPPSDPECIKHKTQIIFIYSGWKNIFQQLNNEVLSLISQLTALSGLPADTLPFITQRDQLNETILNLFQAAEQILAQFKLQQEQLESDKQDIEDLDANLPYLDLFTQLNLQNLTPELEAQIQAALQAIFDIFSQDFYFMPAGTLYEICYDITFTPKYDLYIGMPISLPHSVFITQGGFLNMPACRANNWIHFNQP